MYADDLGILARDRVSENSGGIAGCIREEAYQSKCNVNAKITEVMACTRKAGIETDISDKKKDRLAQVETFKFRGSGEKCQE